MKRTSEEFKNIAESLNGARYYHKITYNGIELEDEIDDFEYKSLCNKDDRFTIGNVCSSTIKFSISNPSINLTNREIEVYEGIKINNSIEYIKLGIFKILKPHNDRNKITYECADRMSYYMDKPYFSKLSLPTTDIEILQEICSQVGISLSNNNLISHTISSIPEGYTRREIISYISQLQGKNAIINSDGNLELIWYKETGYIVDDDRIYLDGTADINDETDYTLRYIECTVIQTDGTSETVIKSGNGTTGIKILNPFMTQEILDEVFSTIGGFSFRSCCFEFLGDFRLEVGDIVTVNTNGNEYKVPIMKLEHSSDGGVITTITSIAETDSENEIDSEGPITKQLERYYAELVLINQAMINKLTVDEADARYISVDKIDAITLTVEKAVIEKLSADFADIHLANIDVADIGKFYANSGLLKDITIVDGHITGELDAVRINADVIKTGTLSVDRLIVTGDDSIVYQINVNSSGLSLEELTDEKYNKYLNGTDIVANSITAAQIKAGTITANEINVSDLFAQDITATGTITGATLIGTTIYAKSGTIGNLSIDDLGRLTCEIDGNFNDNYIRITYGFRDYPAEDEDGNLNYVGISGETGLNTRSFSLSRTYDYTGYPTKPFSINTIAVELYNIDMDIQSDGIKVNKTYYGYNDEYSTTELSQIRADYNGIYFETEAEMNNTYSICNIKFDRLDTKWLLADKIETSAGADLDTINNNLIYGSNTNGVWWKLPNNLLIQAKTVVFTNVAINNAWGNLYESALQDLGKFPIAFSHIPWISLSVVKGSCFIERSSSDTNGVSKTSAGKCYFVMPKSGTQAEIRVHIIAIERYD